MILAEVEAVCRAMRECDRREILGLRCDDNLMSVAWDVVTHTMWSGHGRVFCHRGEPTAVCGAMLLRPGVFSAYAFGTDAWPFVVKDVTRWVRTELRAWLAPRAHRVECQSRADHRRAHAWLVYLGARREAVLTGYGRDGADYYQFVWTG